MQRKKRIGMKLKVIFVGAKFLYNKGLREYLLRQIEQECGEVVASRFYKEGENTLFLDLEIDLDQKGHIVIVTSKQTYPTIGKLLCTITQDNLVLREDTLIPSKASLFAQKSYLLEVGEAVVNVIQAEVMQRLPQLLIQNDSKSAVIQLFNEDEASAKVLFATLSQTYEVQLEFITLIEGWLEVHVKSKKHGDIAKFIQAAKQLLPNKVIPAKNIMTYMIERLSQKGKTVSFGESCTGGLLSYFLTKNNGASKILEGALITYANEIKANWLAVDEAVLERYGAVSAEVVEQMSEGVLRVSEADYAVAISGIAGDTGGTPEKPVGTVFIGVRGKGFHREEHLLLQGDRNYVQYQSVLYAIKLLFLSDIETFF